MKIFLSWSGARSKAIAEALYDWLPRVIQAVNPFFSPEIEKGSDWSAVLDAALKGTGFGIICLTPDNLPSTWIHFEAGALYKTTDAMIWTFLHGVNPGNVPQPLGKFQHTVVEKKDVYRLLTSINGRLAEVGEPPLTTVILRDAFEKNWLELEENLKAAESIGTSVEEPREDKDILLEILETVRNQQRNPRSTSRADVFESSWIAPPGVDSYVRITTRGVPISLELQSEIFEKISNDYPNISLTGDTLGDTSGFNIFFKEPTAISSVPDIVSTIEKMTGISDIEAKVMRVRSRYPIQ